MDERVCVARAGATRHHVKHIIRRANSIVSAVSAWYRCQTCHRDGTVAFKSNAWPPCVLTTNHSSSHLIQ